MKAAAVSRSEGKLADLTELVKARLSFLVIITTLVGFLAAWTGPMDYVRFAATLIGTALSAFGAAALNQWSERDVDALMRRTQDRPLPARRMPAREGLLFGLLFSFAGVICLAALVNLLAASLAAVTIISYVWLYTPLKRVSTLNTLVGAIPGALPPLIGWAAAKDGIQFGGIVLFMILWFWQMPHFIAIAWMYREDYARAGFKMLSVGDARGTISARQSVIYSVCLLAVSLLPSFIGLANEWYFFGALALGLGFWGLAMRFLWLRTRAAARLLFFASILYLPLLLGLLLAARG